MLDRLYRVWTWQYLWEYDTAFIITVFINHEWQIVDCLWSIIYITGTLIQWCRQKVSQWMLGGGINKRSSVAIPLLLFHKFVFKKKSLEWRQRISVHLFLRRNCMKEGWSRPVTSIGKLPSSLDRKITLFRENNTLVSAVGAPRQHSFERARARACVCVSKSLRRRCQPEYKGSLYMISMHLCKTYWTKKACPECCSTPINGLRNYFEPRLAARQLWYVAGEASLLCSSPAIRPECVLIIHQPERICFYGVTRPIKAPPAPPPCLEEH